MTDRISQNAALLKLAKNGSKQAEEQLIKENMGLVRSIAVRFAGRGQELEDLIQIGSIGMLKAVRGYDEGYGTAFSTYAVPLIAGEIKRFLRDDGLIKVSREAKRNYRILMRAGEELASTLGREAHLAELCNACGMSKEDAVYALQACGATVSLQEKVGGEDGVALEELCGDSGLGELTEKIALEQALAVLDDKERAIIYMRYYKGFTQSEIAQRLGMTQVKVSRTEKKIRENIRKMLLVS